MMEHHNKIFKAKECSVVYCMFSAAHHQICFYCLGEVVSCGFSVHVVDINCVCQSAAVAVNIYSCKSTTVQVVPKIKETPASI